MSTQNSISSEYYVYKNTSYDSLSSACIYSQIVCGKFLDSIPRKTHVLSSAVPVRVYSLKMASRKKKVCVTCVHILMFGICCVYGSIARQVQQYCLVFFFIKRIHIGTWCNYFSILLHITRSSGLVNISNLWMIAIILRGPRVFCVQFSLPLVMFLLSILSYKKANALLHGCTSALEIGSSWPFPWSRRPSIRKLYKNT